MNIQNYQIIRELGRGGMGIVLLAKDIKLNREVAIKILNLKNFDDNKNVREHLIYNFKREAIAISNLNHKNIVNVYDTAQIDEDTHCIVMELLDGQPLSKFIEHDVFKIETALEIMIQMCKALSYIHKNNVIHRDIKPENIIYSFQNKNAKLTDFGISKFSEDKKKDFPAGTIIGTILYISPEQLQTPDDVDASSDIYSLGVSFYEILTGRLPIIGNDVREVIMAILGEKPIPVSQYNHNIPKSLEKIIDKTLAKDKKERYKDAESLESDLKNIPEYKDYLYTVFGHEYYEKENKPKLIKKFETKSNADLDWLNNI